MALTKVGPAGIGSTPGTGYVIGNSFLHSTGLDATNAYYTGIVTAQTFRVLGNFQVDGTTTTLDTEVTSVDKLEVAANNTTVGVAITQSGSGDILNLYDGSSEVFSVADGGVVTTTGDISVGGDLTLPDAIVHSGDTNTKIRFPAADTITAETAGVERVRITSDGKVRLPDNVRFTAGAGDDLQIWSNNVNQYIRGEQNQLLIQSNNIKLQSYLGETYIHAANNNAVILYYDNTTKLETTTTGATITSDLILNHASGDKAIRWATGGTNKWSLYHNNGAGALVAYDNANNEERLRITSDGNLGIGIASPNAILTTDPESGNFSSTYNNYDGVGLFIRGNGTSGTGNYGPALVFGSCDSDTSNQDHKHSAISLVQTGTDPNQTGLAFWTHPSNTSTDVLEEALRITSGGNIGIGTDTFTATSSGRQIVEIEGASSSLINLAVGGARKAYHFTDGTDVYSYNTVSGSYIIGTNNTPRLTVTNNGIVEIANSIDLTDSTVDLYSQTTNSASKTFQLFSDIGGTKTEKVSITANGGATFVNRCNFGSSSVADHSGKFTNGDASSSTLYVTNHNNSGDLFSGRNSSNTEVINLGVDGSATFASGALSIASSGNLSVNRTSGTNDVFNGKLNGTATSTINADGSAQFNGAVLIGGVATDNGFKLKVSDGGGYEFALAPNDGGINSLVSYNRSGGAYVDCKIVQKELQVWTGTGPVERLRIRSNGDLILGPYDAPGSYTSAAKNVPYSIKVAPYGWQHHSELAEISMGNHSGSTGNDDGEIVFKTTQNAHSSTTGLVERLRISSTGYVTKPNTPYFSVQASPSLSNFTNYNNSIHSFGTINSNNGSHYNNSTGRFTAPVAGFYWFSGGIWSSNSDNSGGTYHLLLVRDNIGGGTSNEVQFAGCNHRINKNQLTASAGIYMTVGQTVRLWYNGSVQGSTPRNYFSGYLVG